MGWNWQEADWPRFSRNRARLTEAEALFLVEAGEYAGTLKHLDRDGSNQITVEAMGAEAVTTSEIEGEILDRDSVQSSIRRQLGLGADLRRVRPDEEGIAEMMVDLHRSFADPLTEETLFRWHRMVMAGRHDLADVGKWRSYAEPMQIVFGPIHAPKVHFEAPRSSAVPAEIARYLDWFARTAPGASDGLPALTRAGIAHHYFECIHPFEDGNGRIGRAIVEKALAQRLGHPTLTSLAAIILARRRAYYAALAANNKDNEITDWLAWFAAAAIEAQRRAIATVDFMIDKKRLLERIDRRLNERQRKAPLRLLCAGPGGFEGGLTAGKYVNLTGASTATATRATRSRSRSVRSRRLRSTRRGR